MLDTKIINEALKHAEVEAPLESCGLVVVIEGIQTYIPCTNKSKEQHVFYLDPLDYAKCEDMGNIICIVHSHYGVPPIPSTADLVGCESSKLPWLIVNQPAGTHNLIYPTGFILPLKGREFTTGILDCFSLVQDYYTQVLSIEFPYHARDKYWWRRGENLIEDNITAWGFNIVSMDNIQLHDVILMQCNSSVFNHMAVYIGDGKILHHAAGQLSKEDLLGGYWLKCSKVGARHKNLQ